MERIWILMARKLAGEITPSEQLELENLLRNNPDIHYPLETISEIWKRDTYPDQDGLQQRDADTDTEEAWNKHSSRLQQSLPAGNVKTSKKYVMLAMAIIPMIVIIYFIRPAKKPPAHTPVVNELATKPGAKTKHILPDGSRVWLNADSKLSYGPGFGVETREVRLSGEGYFDVVKDSTRPFIIHTLNMDLKVLGTSFNVKSYPGEATSEASLISGSLEVSLPSRQKQKIVLLPNEKLVVANEPKDPITSRPKPQHSAPPLVSIKSITHFEKDDSLIVETSWVQNKLAFQDESFREIALRMEKWFAVAITIEDQLTAEMRFTGIFEKESIGQALYAMSLTEPFKYEIKEKTIIISAPGRKRMKPTIN
jgi:transmembrane sensor